MHPVKKKTALNLSLIKHFQHTVVADNAGDVDGGDVEGAENGGVGEDGEDNGRKWMMTK